MTDWWTLPDAPLRGHLRPLPSVWRSAEPAGVSQDADEPCAMAVRRAERAQTGNRQTALKGRMTRRNRTVCLTADVRRAL